MGMKNGALRVGLAKRKREGQSVTFASCLSIFKVY